MLENITRSFILSWLFVTLVYADTSNSIIQQQQLINTMLESSGMGFSNLEHRELGDSIRIKLDPNGSPQSSIRLSLPNGLKLRYGEIVMYAGDMFGDSSKPISSCKSNSREACFKAQFAALALYQSQKKKDCHNPALQISRLETYLADLQERLEKARQNGESDWGFYKKNASNISKKLNRITCGGSLVSDYIPFGSYIKLSQVNFDHFVPDSLTAYKTGHTVALNTALKAHQMHLANHQEESRRLLELAYAQNAFANHYLTDSMAAGHMRTPRRVVHNSIKLPAVLKLLIANLMHDEDNHHGLNVVNKYGISWQAFGDGELFKPEAVTHLEMIKKIMQLSADSIFDTYITGQLPNAFPELDWMPDYDRIAELNDTAPLFKVKNGKLLKRKKNFDPYDHHWTSTWSGLVTLINFQLKK